MRIVKTIDDLYKYSKEETRPMLVLFNADFWVEYNLNPSVFDRIFRRMYSSFFPAGQRNLTIGEVAEEFSDDVEAWLTINKKRYSELWRGYNITDNDAYSLTNNVDYTETLTRDEGKTGETIKGAQTNTDTSETEYGSKTDTETLSTSYGEQTVTDEKDNSYGAVHSETENSTSAYNENTYTPVTKQEQDENSRTDELNTEIHYGSHTDGASNSRTYGTHTDDTSETHVEGSRTDSTSEDIEVSQSIRRVGNMGVQTVDDMLGKHWRNWSDVFKFYELVFHEIAANLLHCC